MDSLTTFVCLFHHEAEARGAINDLREAGVPEASISLIGGPGSVEVERSELASMGLPNYDYDHLKHGICNGGLVVSVSATGDVAAAVEEIFGRHHADFVDEADVPTRQGDVMPTGMDGSGTTVRGDDDARPAGGLHG